MQHDFTGYYVYNQPHTGDPWEKGQYLDWQERRRKMEEKHNFFDRMVRAAKLDPTLYEDVEADKGAFGQAAAVVVLSSLAVGVGAITSGGIGALLTGTVAALLGWLVWAYITYLVGTKILPEPQTEADYGQLLRTLGFASAPGLIRVLGIIPGLFWIVSLAASLWMIAAMVVAIRQALDYESTFRALGVCIIGWTIQIFFLILLFAIFGGSSEPV